MTIRHSLALFILTAAAASAGVELRWDSQIERPNAYNAPVFRGETVRLMPRLVRGSVAETISGGAATLYWQTNGMGQAWWSKPAAIQDTEPGRLVATFAPTNDVGATSYTWFIRVDATNGGTSYRAMGTLAMRDSPGWSPTAAPPPTAQWVTPGELQAVSNALASAIQECGGVVAGDYLPLAGGTMDFNAQQLFQSPAGLQTAVSPSGVKTFLASQPGSALNPDGLLAQGLGAARGSTSYKHNRVQIHSDIVLFPNELQDWEWTWPYDEETNKLNFASREWVQGALSTFDPPDTDAKIAAATNELIQTYILTSNSWMIVSNDTLSVYAPTGSAAVASLVWSSSESSGTSIGPDATNLLWQALSAGLGAVHTELGAKAPTAWGQYAPDGSANPEPAFMTFLNAPAIVLAGGATWATSGAYSVLVADGTVAFAAGASGELRIGPDLATNWFGYRQGGSYMVGARADAFEVHDIGTTNGYATIVYDYDSGDFPVMWFTATLSLDFVMVDAVWVDNTNGSATATVAAHAAGGFYRATTTASIDSVFVSTMPAVFESGVVGSTNAAPVIYDSTITVSSGGKTYRIPAQEVK